MSFVKLVNISKTFDKKTYVIKDFSLTINSGDFVVFIGPSGCGKTTLLSIVAGLENQSSGEIYFDEVEISNLSPKERNIAMVFQNHTLYPNKSVYDNLAFPLKIRKIPQKEIENKINEMANLLQIESLLSRRPSQLSGGQQQRVAIGKALIREPKMFLMDEPLSSLDSNLRTELRREIKQLHNKLHSTFIYVTHDQIEALSLATKIVVMDKGVVQQIGTPYEVFRYPANLFVAQFIGSYPINTLELMVSDVEIILFDYQIHFNKKRKSLFVCIRPEDFEIVQSTKKNFVILSVEMVGSNTLIAGKLIINDIEYSVSLEAENSPIFKVGVKLCVYAPCEKLLFFDGDSKKRLSEYNIQKLEDDLL